MLLVPSLLKTSRTHVSKNELLRWIQTFNLFYKPKSFSKSWIIVIKKSMSFWEILMRLFSKIIVSTLSGCTCILRSILIRGSCTFSVLSRVNSLTWIGALGRYILNRVSCYLILDMSSFRALMIPWAHHSCLCGSCLINSLWLIFTFHKCYWFLNNFSI